MCDASRKNAVRFICASWDSDMALSRALPSGVNDPVVVVRLRQLKSHVLTLVVRIQAFRQHPTIQLRCFDLSPNAFRRRLVRAMSQACRLSPFLGGVECNRNLSPIDAVSFFQPPSCRVFISKSSGELKATLVDKRKVRSPSTPHEGLIGLSAKPRLRCFCDFAPQ